MVKVPPEGKKSARLVLIGEAPGSNEMRLRRPFVGKSGKRLEEWWRMFGLRREDFWIDNVLDYQPRDIDAVPRTEMEQAIAALHERLYQLDDPWLIVPTGNYALYALTGNGKVSWHRKDDGQERPGIETWRGSILSYEGRLGRGPIVKVIPTIHPAAGLRAEQRNAAEGGWYEKVSQGDWARIASDSKFRELRHPEYDTRIRPTLDELRTYTNDALARGKWLVVDIETPKRVSYCRPKLKKGGFGKRRKKVHGRYLACVGFCWGETYDYETERVKLSSMTVPTTRDYWGDDFDEAMGCIATLLVSNLEKVAQSGMFDFWWLLDELLPIATWIKTWKWDLRGMHHTLEPIDVHDLGYMGSRYTRQPYWKNLRDEKESGAWGPERLDNYWTYCGTDCCVEGELFLLFLMTLSERGRLGYYLQRFAELFEILLDVGRHGVRQDLKRCDERRQLYAAECVKAAAGLEAIAGMPLIAKKAISKDRLCYFLYGPNGLPGVLKGGKTKVEALLKKFPHAITIRLPVRYKHDKKTKTKKITTDEVTVRRLMQRFPDKLEHTAPLILDHRRNTNLLEFVDEGLPDPDGRVRCQYSPGFTDTTRLTAASTPRDTGRNLQNIDREVRDIYVPDLDPDARREDHPPAPGRPHRRRKAA